MACTVCFTDQFEAWWNELTVEEQVSVDGVVYLLEAEGVNLGYPF